MLISGDESFEAAYRRGIVEEDRDTGPARALAPARAPLGTGLAWRGCVLGPDGPMEDGYVVVGPDGRIAAVQAQAPDGVDVLDTGGVIVPGLLDLHGHPEFNVFAAWEPPQLFANRYEWRSSEIYRQLVREPQNRLVAALPAGTQARYAEIRAMVGGVTAIQGASGRYPQKDEALVRNVDLRIFGEHRARAMIDLPSDADADGHTRLRRILDGIAAGEVAAFYLHLAEGRRDDERSRREFDRLVALDALTPATVLIHGTALTREQLGMVRDAGASLVWSPQSNLRLYAETTDVATALEIGVPVALGADWLPSGSQSLLGELKVARRVLADQGRPAPARQLVEMATVTAARIAGLDAFLGRLAPGRPADLVVLERHRADPWENVVDADPAWVEAVMIGGDLSYGRAEWVARVVGAEAAGALESLVVWGKPMRLDTGFAAASRDGGKAAPTLAQLRADLISHYPPVGPIFA